MALCTYVAVFVVKHLRYRLTDSLELSDSATKPSDRGSSGDSSSRLLKLILSVVFQDSGILLAVSVKIQFNYFHPSPVHAFLYGLSSGLLSHTSVTVFMKESMHF